MKILLIRLDHLGDLVLMTPLIRALAKAGHAVDVLCLRHLNVIFEGNPHVSEVFAVEEVAPGFPAGWMRLGAWMRKQAYDCILLPNPKPRQLLWSSFLSGARRRLAMQSGIWGRLTGHRSLRVQAAFQQGRHFSDIQLDFARALGVPTDGLKLDYFCRESEIREAREKIASVFPDFGGEPIVGIHPGSLGNTCNLPSSVYGELAALILARTDWKIVITGGTKERALLEAWPKEVLASPRVYKGMGAFDLRGLGALISLMSNYVIVGTGPLHLASAIGIRTTSPFCGLPPLTFSNWGNKNGLGVCVQPNPERCRRWIAQAPAHQHCDFRGEVTAENLWSSLSENRSIQL